MLLATCLGDVMVETVTQTLYGDRDLWPQTSDMTVKRTKWGNGCCKVPVKCCKVPAPAVEMLLNTPPSPSVEVPPFIGGRGHLYHLYHLNMFRCQVLNRVTFACGVFAPGASGSLESQPAAKTDAPEGQQRSTAASCHGSTCNQGSPSALETPVRSEWNHLRDAPQR